MADNRNRGPNDLRGRDGRRRREPPIIDASATEVPSDDAAVPAGRPEPVAPGEALPAGEAPAADAPKVEAAESAAPVDAAPAALDASASPAESEPSADPVLFGGMRRDPSPRTEPADLPAEPAPGTAPEADRAVPEDAPALGAEARSPASEPLATPPSAPAPVPAGGTGGLWLLGLSNLVLLGALAWVLYGGTQGQGRDAAALADLRTKVAALEARPDPSQLGAGVSDLGKRLGAADADRASLAKAVAGLNARLDGVAKQAEGAAAAAGAAQSDASKPAPTGDAAPATAGALAALGSKVDALDARVGSVAGEETKTAQAVADLPKPVPPDFGPTEAKIAALGTELGGKVAALDTAMSGKVAALDARVTALDGKLNGSDAKLNGFDAKVNAVDGKVNGFDARANALDARVNGLESKLTGDGDALAKLRASVDGLAPLTAATAALDGRIAKVEGQLAAPKDGARVTEARAVGSADESRATPVAVVGQAAERAVAEGRPFAPELDALRALGAEPDALAKLAPLAAKGAPTVGMLRARWDAVSADVLAAAAPAESGTALDRLAAGARALVQVRQVGAAPGDDPGALVARIGAALDAGDVSAALAAWGRLPAPAQDRSEGWAAAARGRSDALAAARGIVGRAVATLGRTKS